MTCSECPKRDRNGWCVHLATLRPPNAPACEWGKAQKRRKKNAAPLDGTARSEHR